MGIRIATQKLAEAIDLEKYSQAKVAIEEGAKVNSIFNFGYSSPQDTLRKFIWKVDYRVLAPMVKNGFKITDKMRAKAGVDSEGERILARFQERIQDAQILIAESSLKKQLITKTLVMLPTALVTMIHDYDLPYLDEISDQEYVIEKHQLRSKESMRYQVYVEMYFPKVASALCQAVFNNVQSNFFDNNCSKDVGKYQLASKAEETYGSLDMGGLSFHFHHTKYDNRILFTILNYVRD